MPYEHWLVHRVHLVVDLIFFAKAEKNTGAVIGSFGVVNTLTMSVIERRRKIWMLRATGPTGRDWEIFRHRNRHNPGVYPFHWYDHHVWLPTFFQTTTGRRHLELGDGSAHIPNTTDPSIERGRSAESSRSSIL
jgi:hypothetical protein